MSFYKEKYIKGCPLMEQYLSFSMLALDLHVVISDLHAELIRREVLDVQVDSVLVSIRPHLWERITHSFESDGEQLHSG